MMPDRDREITSRVLLVILSVCLAMTLGTGAYLFWLAIKALHKYLAS